MPTWIFVCIWVIWVFFAIVNIYSLKMVMQGKGHFKDGGNKAFLFWLASIFWIGYNVSLFF